MAFNIVMLLCVVAIAGAIRSEKTVEADGSFQLAAASDEAAAGEGAGWSNAESSVAELLKAVTPVEDEWEGVDDYVDDDDDDDDDNITNKGSVFLKQCAGNPKLLGVGMYGSVYKMVCHKPFGHTGVTGAVKVMSKTIAFKKGVGARPTEREVSFGAKGEKTDDRAAKAFNREVDVQRAAAALGLAPKVYSHEIFRADQSAVDKGLRAGASAVEAGVPYGRIFMAIAPGKSLKNVLNSENKEAVWAVLNKVADAINTLHNAGLFHGDLSFDNVYIDGDKVTLIDFGKAQKGSNQKMEGVFESHCKFFFKLIPSISNHEDLKPGAAEHNKCSKLAMGQQV